MLREPQPRTAGRNEIPGAAHEVLDLFDAMEAQWRSEHSFEEQLSLAHYRSKLTLKDGDTLAQRKRMAVSVAARMIDAIGEINRRLAAGEA